MPFVTEPGTCATLVLPGDITQGTNFSGIGCTGDTYQEFLDCLAGKNCTFTGTPIPGDATPGALTKINFGGLTTAQWADINAGVPTEYDTGIVGASGNTVKVTLQALPHPKATGQDHSTPNTWQDAGTAFAYRIKSGTTNPWGELLSMTFSEDVTQLTLDTFGHDPNVGRYEEDSFSTDVPLTVNTDVGVVTGDGTTDVIIDTDSGGGSWGVTATAPTSTMVYGYLRDKPGGGVAGNSDGGFGQNNVDASFLAYTVTETTSDTYIECPGENLVLDFSYTPAGETQSITVDMPEEACDVTYFQGEKVAIDAATAIAEGLTTQEQIDRGNAVLACFDAIFGDDTDVADAFCDAWIAGFLAVDSEKQAVMAYCIQQTEFEVTIDKDVLKEAAQGVDADADGDIGQVDVTVGDGVGPT